MNQPLRQTETNISKTLVIVGCAAVLAAMTTLVPTAEAGRHGGGGGGARFSSGAKFHHHHHRRHIIVTPVYTETYKVVRKPVIQEQVAAVRIADGMGRVYDIASKVWHDGQNHCWSGKLPWTFKNGSWFYGSYSWTEANGTWSTNAPEAPVSVACETVPAFTAKAPTVGQTQLAGTQGDANEARNAPAVKPAPIKTAGQNPSDEPVKFALPQDGNAAKTSECKKYFPNVGEMLPVPCTL